MLLTLNSTAHLFVDAVCAALIFSSVEDPGSFAAMLIYNTLAFAGQAPAGLFVDLKLPRRYRGWLKFLSCALVAAGFFLPDGVPLAARVVLTGAGNCFFHVLGGTDTLDDSRGRAAPLGLFVAPGCVGLALGSLYPGIGTFMAAGLLLLGSLSLAYEIKVSGTSGKARQKDPTDGGRFDALAVVMLTAAVAVRAYGGSIAAFPWKSGALETMLLTCAVFTGKAAGGLVSDRIGPRRAAALTIPPAALFTAFAAALMLPSLAGQLLLNISMPITLWLLYKHMPDKPATAFGLAAAALWPGTLAGSYLAPAVTLAPYVTLAAFAFALFAVYCSSERGERQ